MFKTIKRMLEMDRSTVTTYGRCIKNATIGGKLEVFERVNYYQLFDKNK